MKEEKNILNDVTLHVVFISDKN